jgi:shikimate dehydrogenase
VDICSRVFTEPSSNAARRHVIHGIRENVRRDVGAYGGALHQPMGRKVNHGPDSYLGFIGVSTSESSIMTVFPQWAEALGLPTRRLIGRDLLLDSPAEVYREVVATIRDDPRHWGALVTTHKIAVYAAASDIFDSLDEPATTFGEISCIAKRGDRLLGSAKDPVTVRLALEEFLPDDHFRRNAAAALVLGSGGAGTALTHQLGVRDDRPERIVCTSLSAEPLEHARTVHERAGISDGLISYVVTTDSEQVDRLLESLPPSSLVVNATGMGKDRPGSPISNDALFPDQGVVWDFNYRGALDFLAQARRQQTERRLQVEDGWRYFIHGWSQAVAEVFDIPMPPATVDELGRIAARLR